jgi:hypothetical protein
MGKREMTALMLRITMKVVMKIMMMSNYHQELEGYHVT